jgi:hypothetical protein
LWKIAGSGTYPRLPCQDRFELIEEISGAGSVDGEGENIGVDAAASPIVDCVAGWENDVNISTLVNGSVGSLITVIWRVNEAKVEYAHVDELDKAGEVWGLVIVVACDVEAVLTVQRWKDDELGEDDEVARGLKDDGIGVGVENGPMMDAGTVKLVWMVVPPGINPGKFAVRKENPTVLNPWMPTEYRRCWSRSCSHGSMNNVQG